MAVPERPTASLAPAHPIADPERRRQARAYARRGRALLVVDLGLSATALLIFLVSGLSGWLRTLLVAHLPGFLLPIALFVVCLALGYAVFFLPLAYYGGFVLPHRYGLSAQTRPAWLADYVKGTGVGLVQALVLALAVYALLRAAPEWWWLWAALVMLVFVVALANLAPVLIVPLFFKLRPLADERLSARLVGLAARAGTQVRGVFVMDLSRRTRAANAAVMGLGNTRRIVLGDTLLDHFAPEEVETVLAHELGHHVHHDLWRGMAVESALTLLALWLANLALRWLIRPLGLAGLDDVAGLPLLLLVSGALFVLVMPLVNGYSRRREAAADRFAVRATGDVASWQSALAKFADQNLSDPDPPAWAEWLLYSHPSIRHRLEAAARAAPEPGMPDSGSFERQTRPVPQPLPQMEKKEA